jgi:Armadillo/beta-catenin-like repeat
LTNSKDEVIEKVATDFVMKKIISLLESPNIEIKAPALRAIGNISSGTSIFTKKLWGFGVYKKLEPLLDNKKPAIRREALWSFSNFLAEDANIVANMLEANLFQKIITKIFSDVDDVIEKNYI